MLRNLFLVIEFEIRAFLSDIPGIIRMFIEPIAYLFLLAQGLKSSFLVIGDVDYFSFVFPGIVALQLFRLFLHSIYRLTIDRRWGLQALKISSGTGLIGYILGMSAVPITLFILQTVIIYPLALTLGTIFTIKGLLSLLFVGTVSSLFWTFLSIGISFFFKKYSQRDLFLNFLILPLSLSAPIFYQLKNVPFYLKAISTINPLSYQVIALREAFLFGEYSTSFLTILLLTAALFFIAGICMKKADFLPSQT